MIAKDENEMNTRKIFVRAVAGRFSDRVNRIDRIMGNERKS